jgi:hypothetical protein
MPRDIRGGVPQGSVLSPTLYRAYINDTPQTSDVYLGLFADDTDRKEGYVLRKLQRGLRPYACTFLIDVRHLMLTLH